MTTTNVETASEETMQESMGMSYAEEIETVISGMAEDRKVMVAKNEAGHLWKFKYGSVEVFIKLTGETEDDTLTVWAYVLKLPAKNEPQLMRKLLEMNWLYTMESHFAIVDEQIAILATRTVAELSPGEISRSITIVATLADDNDDILQAEFGQ
jgi:hypothetical protein